MVKDEQESVTSLTVPLVAETAPRSSGTDEASAPPVSKRSAPDGIAFVQRAQSLPSSTVTGPPKVLVAAR